MSTTAEAVRNGVDTEQLFGTLDAIKANPTLARFQFRARNRWIDGAHNRSTIRDFYAANQEDTSRAEEFVSFFRRWYGPTLKAFASLEGDARDALEADLTALARRFDRLGAGAVAIPSTYTEAVALRR